MSKIFCFHHYSPRTRYVSLSADCSDKHLEPIWFCEKCGKTIPRKPSDYIKTDKPGSQKAWYRIIGKPVHFGMGLIVLICLMIAFVFALQAHNLVLVTFRDCVVWFIMILGIIGFGILGHMVAKILDKDCMNEMVKLGYYTKGEKK